MSGARARARHSVHAQRCRKEEGQQYFAEFSHPKPISTNGQLERLPTAHALHFQHESGA